MRLRDLILASDPPLERLRLALRSTCALVLAGLPLVVLMKLGLVPGPIAALGAMVALWSSLQANDPAPRDRKITAALLPFAAAFGVTLCTLLAARNQVLGPIGFLAICFAGVWVRRFGPRGFGLGMMALFVSFFSLFLKVQVAWLPVAFGAILLGGGVAWIVRFFIVPDSPHLALRSAEVAFRARLRLLARTLGAARDVRVANDVRDENFHETIRRQLIALNAAALAIDELVAGEAFDLDDGARDRARADLLTLELAAERLAAQIANDACNGAPAGRRDEARAEQVEEAIGALARGDRSFAQTLVLVSGEAGDPPARSILELIAADERAEISLRVVENAKASGKADAPLSAGAKPPDVGGIAPTTRQAIQITAASAAALVLGTLIPPHQYFWAVLTAFIVYNQTASASEALRRTVARTFGTVVGVGFGFLLVDLVRGHHPLEMTLAFVCVFAGLYTFRLSYFTFTFFLTATVAMLYDVVGRPVDELLTARLVETIVGAICGALAAIAILPIRTRAVVRVDLQKFATALSKSVRSVAAAFSDAAAFSETKTIDAARETDKAFQEVIARARPMTERKPAAPDAEMKIATSAVFASAAASRELTASALTVRAVAPPVKSEPIPATELETVTSEIARLESELAEGDATASLLRDTANGLYRIDRNLARLRADVTTRSALQNEDETESSRLRYSDSR